MVNTLNTLQPWIEKKAISTSNLPPAYFNQQSITSNNEGGFESLIISKSITPIKDITSNGDGDGDGNANYWIKISDGEFLVHCLVEGEAIRSFVELVFLTFERQRAYI